VYGAVRTLCLIPKTSSKITDAGDKIKKWLSDPDKKGIVEQELGKLKKENKPCPAAPNFD
jgi:hypothetical protein